MSYVVLPLLSALASAIGNTHRIELKRGWTEPPIVWTVAVGESGTLKTPPFKLAMKIIRKAETQAFKEYAAAKKEWESEYIRYEAELAGWKRRAASGKGNAGNLPEKPTPPISRRHIVSDPTVESLAPILLGNPRGVLLARDELNGWLQSFGLYHKTGKGGAASAHWLSMHNGEAMIIDRKTGIPPTIYIPAALVSITGGIQPGILAASMVQEHHDSGMLARLLFAMPPRLAKRWTEAEVDADTEALVAAVFEKLLGLTMDIDQNDDACPRLVGLTPNGHAAWVRFYNEHATEQADLSGDEAAAWSKLEGYAARLALVIHLTRWAAGDTSLRDPTRVDEASIAAGVVQARWFGYEARRVYAILSESDKGRESRRLVEWIERRGGSVTVRELTRGPREYRGNVDRAEKALRQLVAAGAGKWEVDDHDGGRGRPVERFRISTPLEVIAGDTNSENVGVNGISVAVATVTSPINAGDVWGAL
ncbi:MAG: YfjI family protein [Gemmatales bacterium]